MKSLSLIDKVIIEIEQSLRTCHVKPHLSERPYPAKNIDFDDIDETERLQVARLMRVNNAGEVAAQGLYRGQASSAKNLTIQKDMLDAAREENEHLNWCQTRLDELGAKRSVLDPVWYWGSFILGLSAGAAGNKWSLGFVEETEKQVGQHLDEHLQQLPAQDARTRHILEQMKTDELRHAENAHKAGAAALPVAVQKAMHLVSKVMTFSAFRI